MLIAEALKLAVRDGRLLPARPIAPWEGEPRAFLMCQPLHTAIQAGRTSDDEQERSRWARLEADIDDFVTGAYMTEKLIKQLKPPKGEHWELLSRRPKPSLRVFGRFARPDVFVGTHVVLRKELGGMWSPQFEHEKLVCEDHWNAAGLPEPFTAPPGYMYEAYITANARKDIGVPR